MVGELDAAVPGGQAASLAIVAHASNKLGYIGEFLKRTTTACGASESGRQPALGAAPAVMPLGRRRRWSGRRQRAPRLHQIAECPCLPAGRFLAEPP
jgi:hypothetical protein